MEYQKQPPKDFKSTMDYKGDQIKAAQATKNNSIIMAGSARDATLIMCNYSHLYMEFDQDQVKAKWKEWRDWFYNQQDVPFI